MIIKPYKGKSPIIHPTCFIAQGVVIIGDVEIGEYTNIWYGCVIRGDVNTIRIGKRTNIQDGTVVHVTRKTGPTVIGDNITIGHSVLLHACTLENDSFVGMHSTVMDGAVVQSNAMLAAGALLAPNKTVLTGHIWAGSPARYMRDLKQEELDYIGISASNYAKLGQEYKETSV